MKRIASFEVDHNTLEKGIYLSRIDHQNIFTYDIRLKKPNSEPVLENAALHTMEHLFATFVRNSNFSDNIIYFGPMGCRTGFYFITIELPFEKAISLIKQTFSFIENYKGEIPGITAKECGNYIDHDLQGARKEAKMFLPVIEHWSEENLKY